MTVRPHRRTAVALALAGVLLAGCGATDDDAEPAESAIPSGAPSAGSSSQPPSEATVPPLPEQPDPAPGSTETLEVDGRSFDVVVPPAYDADQAAPLVMLLHGFGSQAAEVDAMLGLRPEAERRGALYVLPEGTTDSGGRRFWDATEACCGFWGEDVDDSGYLADVLRTVVSRFAVDPARVAVVGHSNGGFMAYRLACDHADLVTAVVSVAGAMTSDAGACAPSRPVSVLQVHGTTDSTIRFDGGSNGPYPYPSATESIAAWARLDGCATQPVVGEPALDLETAVAGAETEVASFPDCADGARVELWSMRDAEHAPRVGDDFAEAVLSFALGSP